MDADVFILYCKFHRSLLFHASWLPFFFLTRYRFACSVASSNSFHSVQLKPRDHVLRLSLSLFPYLRYKPASAPSPPSLISFFRGRRNVHLASAMDLVMQIRVEMPVPVTFVNCIYRATFSRAEIQVVTSKKICPVLSRKSSQLRTCSSQYQVPLQFFRGFGHRSSLESANGNACALVSS